HTRSTAGSRARPRCQRVRSQRRRSDQPAAPEDRGRSERTGVHQDGAERRLCVLRGRHRHWSRGLRLSFPDTISGRNGLTTVLCLALLALTNLGLAYLEESPDTRLAEWLLPARIIDTIHILQAAPPSRRSNIAASLSTASLGVPLRDNPIESAELLDTF